MTLPALETLKETLQKRVGGRAAWRIVNDQAAIDVGASDYLDVMARLIEAPDLAFCQLIDLCGVDYSAYTGWTGPRFAVVSQLLSISTNRRLRVRCFAPDDAAPTMPSVVSIWNSADWFEREAFDLFGIVFEGRGDLRRILTDYDFDGYPLRKDFPVVGTVEAGYDETERRVVYAPVSIAERVVVPRVSEAAADD